MKLFDRILNAAGALVGRAENALHAPLYPIKYYVQPVVPGVLYRGAWPNARRLETLKLMGINTIVNLCSERDNYDSVALTSLEMSSYWIPIQDNSAPTKKQAHDFIQSMRYRFKFPVYIHCEEGIGRTGCMIAAYRVYEQNWTPQRALQEAESFGLRMPCERDFILALKSQ